ncbi:hypothetical protein [Stenotrophomonas sp. PD6]|uniref:hypothetical protein n=1 Tax=Stenotrophomonas sp. PD6 TaxID=3368612 RepID=UPI003B9F9FA7
MRNESVGLVDLRRNLSALLDTTRVQPLMVHRYGTPWAYVVSDAQWRQHRVQLEFDPGSHPLAHLQQLQRDILPLPAQGGLSSAACARALILQAIYAFEDIGELHESICFDRLLHWFVDAGGSGAEPWHVAELRAAIADFMEDTPAMAALFRFLGREDVVALAAACGGQRRETAVAFKAMTGR